MQLFPAFFVSDIARLPVRMLTTTSRGLAGYPESSKLTTLINQDGGSTTDALARGRELLPRGATKPTRSRRPFVAWRRVGVTSGGLQKCTHPDFFFSHSWRDSPEESGPSSSR